MSRTTKPGKRGDQGMTGHPDAPGSNPNPYWGLPIGLVVVRRPDRASPQPVKEMVHVPVCSVHTHKVCLCR